MDNVRYRQKQTSRQWNEISYVWQDIGEKRKKDIWEKQNIFNIKSRQTAIAGKGYSTYKQWELQEYLNWLRNINLLGREVMDAIRKAEKIIVGATGIDI